MRTFLAISAALAVAACSGDDGVNHTAPDTAFDDVPPALSNQPHVRILFHALGNANGFVCTLDGATPSSCISPFEADVADGEHTFAVSAALNTGVDETPAIHTWTVDATPPDTTIDTAPPALDNSAAPTFAFSGADPGGGPVTFSCSLDGGAFAPCTSPATVAAADGAHTYAVRSSDAAGNADPTPAMHAWTIDTTAPDTLITAGPAEGSTTAAAASFTFSSPDATATFECAVDGAAFAACTSPVALTLADGAHTFAARAKDAIGIVDPSPALRTWTVDAVAPTVTLTATPTNPTNDTTPTFGFTASEATVTYECQIDGVVTFTACAPPWDGPAVTAGSRTFRVRATDAVGNLGPATTFTWIVDTAAPVVTLTAQPAALSNDTTPSVSFTVAGGPATTTCKVDGGTAAACTSPFTSAALADGAHTITVLATDAAGNTGMATTAMFTIDTAAPVITIVPPTTPTNDTTPTITFMISEPATATCKVDALAAVACAPPSFTPTLANGSHTITINATDTAGNAAAPKSTTVVVDTTAPVITITAPASPTNDTTPTITFAISEPATATCAVDGGAAVACSPPSFTPTLAAGSHTITFNATDTAGNAAAPKSVTVVVDLTAPVIAVTTPTSPTADTTPTISFSISEPATATCKVDANAAVACAPPSFTPTLAEGSHTITFNATDTAGNPATPVSVTVVVDLTGPTITFLSVPTSPSNDTTPSVTFSVSGGGGTLTCQVDTNPATACTTSTSFTAGALPDGDHTITVAATDPLGNPGSATTAPFKIDTTPPTVAIDDAPPAQWPVNYYDFAFSSPSDPGASFTCSLNGAAFTSCTSGAAVTTSYGTASSFRVLARDAAGNTSTTPAQATWTATDGLVLHYPWEQGLSHNTSLLAQRPAYSPDGASPVPVVGGWAGTAAGSPANHKYVNTARALSSSATSRYTASIWVRPTAASSGVLWSNAGTDGVTLRISGSAVAAQVFQGGALAATVNADIAADRWTNLTVRSGAGGKGIDLLVNGNLAGSTAAGVAFGANQLPSLIVGGLSKTDVDDLRFFNRPIASGTEMCTVVLRGEINVQGACTPLIPGFELDLEGAFTNSGAWGLQVFSPSSFAFLADKLGIGLQLTGLQDFFGVGGFASFAPFQQGHTFSAWANTSGSTAGPVIDFTTSCPPGANNATCGLSLRYTDNTVLELRAGTPFTTLTKTLSVAQLSPPKLHNYVVAERRSGSSTVSIFLFVDGTLATQLDFGGTAGDVFGTVSDTVQLPFRTGQFVDELEFWPLDLSKDPEVLCENGFDGEWAPATSSCLLTSQ